MCKCCTPYCKNQVAARKRHCHKRIKRKYRAAHPIEASYQNLRSNAKRRGHEFTITLSYFKRFCYRTDYIANKGRKKDCYTVDRIKNNRGYVPGNIQAATNSNNSRKGAKVLSYDYATRYAVVITMKPLTKTADMPF